MSPLKTLSENLTGLVRGRLWMQVIVGMVLGVLTGILLGPSVGWVRESTGLLVAVRNSM